MGKRPSTGGGDRQQALIEWFDDGGSGQTEIDVFLGGVVQGQRLRGADFRDGIVIESEDG